MKSSKLFLCLFLTCLFSYGFAQTTLINIGSNWKYYDLGNDPFSQGSLNWYDIDYDDSSWEGGNAELGYGDDDEETVLDSSSLTCYFRNSFNIVDASLFDNLDLDLTYDDGAVVYLNGTEVWRVNMPTGAVDYNTFSSGSAENADDTLNISNTLVDGINVISVEIHQNDSASIDLSFDFKLVAKPLGTVNVIRGPYLQMASQSSMIVRWRTDTATESIIQYGTSINNLDQTVNDLGLKTEHEINITGLTSNTLYYYQIENSANVLVPAANDLYLQSFPVIGVQQPLRAWILGDCGTAGDRQRAVRNAYYNFIDTNSTDMILFLGDNAYDDGTDIEYQFAVFEDMYENKLKNTVSWSTKGNHEVANSNLQTGPYFDIFTFPTAGESGGIASGTEAYYSFDYGNIHFICLDSHDTDRDVGGAMYDWCESDIQNTTADWIVAFWHHPPYSKGSHDSDVQSRLIQMRENFLPMLEDNGIDLVLTGHSHTYERTYLLQDHYGLSNTFDINIHTVGPTGDGNGKEDGDGAYIKQTTGSNAGDGAVYITTGTAGRQSTSATLDHSAMVYSVLDLGSCILEVDGNQMDVKFLRDTNTVTFEDYFTIIKQENAPIVNITDPLNNDYYSTPQTITITAEASDSNGTITQVEFFVDNVSIGVDTDSVYSMDWTIPSDGNYSIKAVATDDENNISSSIINILVGPLNACSKINKSSDDAEEKASGNVSITSGDLELINDGTDQTIGMRFENLNIPQCAVIENAFIQFTVDEAVNINPCTIQIFGEAHDNPSTFQNSNNHLSNRTMTVASVEWSPPDWNTIGANGPEQKTVDIAPVIQEIVDRVGFTSNSAIVILIEGTGKRVAESFNGGSVLAPEICIEYIPFGPDDDGDGTCNANDLCPNGPEPGTLCDDGDAGTYDDVIDSNCICIGIPFDCPSIPANIGDLCDDNDPGTYNDVIDSNCICVGIQYDCYPQPIDIGDLCDDNDPGTYNDVIDSNCNCIGIPFDCPSIPANIGDMCDDGDPNTVDDMIDSNCICVGTLFDCPNIPGNIGDPCDDGDPNTSNDVIEPFCICLGITTTSSSISQNNDDAEERPSGTMSLTSSDLEMIIDGNNYQVIGLRFNNLNILQGASIESAQIQFTADQTDNNNPSELVISGEASDDAAIFASSNSNITNRPKTVASLVWSPPDWITVGDAGPAQQTDDITAIIQEVVDRNGFSSNSSIVIIIEGIGKRTAISHDGNANQAAELTITYKCNDANNDGICDSCPNGSEPGDPCDDGDPNTLNDMIDANCDCVGTFYDCPAIPANIGDPCDDGDPNTLNDMIDSNCICVGTYDCPTIPANIGDPCDDGDPNTLNDMIDSNCICVGTFYDCPAIPANIGDSCDDGDPGTYDDTVDSNCNCVGTPYDCPAIPANIGDPCDDGNPNTPNDVITSNCECLGDYDCPAIPANIGDPCDDGDPNTSNDAIDANCDCVGTLFDCPSIPGDIGDPCDDGDPNSTNDVIDANCICLGSITTTSQINQSSDDAEEKPNGTVSVTSSDLEMIVDGNNDQTIGLRFINLNIPNGAYIESAFIQFKVDQVDNINPSSLDIYGEASDDAVTFVNSAFNITNRPKTTATLSWSPPNWQNVGESGPDQKTLDIAPIIQEIVERSGYTSSSAIAVIIEGVGKRTAESYNGDQNGAPELIVTYKCNDNNNDGYCDDACPGDEQPGDPCDDGDSETYNDTIDPNCNCTGIPYDCPTIPANIGDTCDDGDSGTYNDLITASCVCEGTLYDCPSIPANIGDSCDDNDPNTIEDEIDSNCDCTGTPLTSNSSCTKINSSSDDAEEKANGQVKLNSSDLEMIIDGTNQAIGLRFVNLNIPKNATIINADIQFTVDQIDNINPCNLDIFGEASDDATTFGGNNDITNRPKTAATEIWSPENWITVHDASPDQKTVNISSIIQEIVDREGYTANSAITIIIDGEGKRTAESFNALPNLAPELCVEYYDPPQNIELNPNTLADEELIKLDSFNENNYRFRDSTLNSINIYPNPATDWLIIAFKANHDDEIGINIFDINGRVLITEKRVIKKGENSLQLENLSMPNGIYFIQLHFNNTVYMSKFMIFK